MSKKTNRPVQPFLIDVQSGTPGSEYFKSTLVRTGATSATHAANTAHKYAKEQLKWSVVSRLTVAKVVADFKPK